MTELSDEWFFLVDLKESSIKFYGNRKQIVGIEEGKMQFPDDLISEGVLHEEDQDLFQTMVESMREGFVRTYCMRFNHTDGEANYYNIIYKVMNEDKKSRFIIGKCINVNEQKLLEKKAQTDLLTGCYNKVTTEALIDKCIQEESEGNHALYIIDIDDFKAINDNLGHQFGDKVLQDVSANLKKCFRSYDIIGRLGGDEFVVFMNQSKSLEVIDLCAQRISNAFKNTYSGEKGDYKISGSIGIAICGPDGRSYQELYKAADRALYVSKEKGKDCYSFASESAKVSHIVKKVKKTTNRSISSFFDADILKTSFGVLSSSLSKEEKISACLSLLGKNLMVSSWCMYQLDERYNFLLPIVATEQADEVKLEKAIAMSNEQGIAYSNDRDEIDQVAYTSELKEAKAFMQLQQHIEGVGTVVIALVDEEVARVWSEKELNGAYYVAQMLFSFMASNIE